MNQTKWKNRLWIFPLACASLRQAQIGWEHQLLRYPRVFCEADHSTIDAANDSSRNEMDS
jgi:hypothetical protein